MNPSYCLHANLCGNTAFETTVDFINYSLIVCVYIYIRVDAHLFSKQLQNDFLFCFCLYCSAMSSISFKTGFSFSKQIFQQMYVKIMVQTVQPVSCTAPLAVSKKKGQTQEKRVERRGVCVCAPVYGSVHVQYLLQRRKMFPSSSSSSSYSLSFSLFLRGFSLLVFPENFTKREAGQMSVRLLPFSVGQCCADSSFPFPSSFF